MPLKFSKKVRPGMLVVKHGDKYILPSRRSRHIVGAYQSAQVNIILTATGTVRVTTPAGIVQYGPTRLQIPVR